MGDWSHELSQLSATKRTTAALSDYSRLSPDHQIEARRCYYALISQVDAALGRLFAKMQQLGLLQNTWIIFTTDHGEMLGDHNLGSKLVHFEGSSHIPMIIRPPSSHPLAKECGTQCDSLVSLADVMPTCLHAAGLNQKADLDGVSLLDVQAKGLQANRVHFGNWSDQFYVVIQDQWKYHWFAQGDESLLFNLENDPYEQTNLIGDERYAAQHEALHNSLRDHLKATGSKWIEGSELKPGPQAKPEREIMRYPGFRSVPQQGLP